MPIILKNSSDGQFLSQVKSGNGEILFTGEMHTRKEKSIQSVKALITEVFKAFEMVPPDMTGREWFFDQTVRKKSIKNNGIE